MAVQDMIDAAPEEIAAIEGAILACEDQIAIHEQKIVDLTDEVMTPNTTSMEAKLVAVTPPDYDYPGGETGTIYVTYNLSYGPEFNVTTISDFLITETTIDGTSTSVVDYYSYQGGSGWDNDPNVTQWNLQWEYAYDYINHPMGLTGTYGLLGLIANLEQGIIVLEANKLNLEKLLLGFP